MREDIRKQVEEILSSEGVADVASFCECHESELSREPYLRGMLLMCQVLKN